jgi:hypothetical protein
MSTSLKEAQICAESWMGISVSSKPRHSRSKPTKVLISTVSAVPTSSALQSASPARSITDRKTVLPVRRIALVVGICYLLLSAFIFRHVIESIPQVLSGEAVINGDELVPFFNVHSQLLDQAAGKFNQLTNGYEFRVRYAILTTWVRYYKILPFAIVLVIPGITFAAYLVSAWFLGKILPQFKLKVIYQLTAAPVLVIFLILAYSKIAHFYTLILGFSMFVIALELVTYGMVFPQEKPYKPILIACIVTLFNPAVHYLVLYALYMALIVTVLVILDLAEAFKTGSWKSMLNPRQWLGGLKTFLKTWRRQFVEVRFWRCVGAFIILGVFTLAPYGTLVKFYFLKGVGNLSETVPADYYFIQDASISLPHLLTIDMAGIMDKQLTGDYLAKDPRWANAVYMLLILLPFLFKRIRSRIFNTKPLQSFFTIAYTTTFFSIWATLGYSDPPWFPTFHRVFEFISIHANDTHTFLGDLIVKLLGTIIQVLRFPHRFEFLMFMMACVLMPISLVWLYETWQQQGFGEIVWAITGRKWQIRSKEGGKLSKPKQAQIRPEAHWSLPVLVVLLVMVPLFSNTPYRLVFFSGDFHQFLTPYPVKPLQQVKDALLQLPPGKVVVLPPTESAKEVDDINDVAHKFIDKFYIYYLDLPSYYYGLTGNSDNKHEFFLLLRALYYQQPWWVNIMRDLDLRYIVVNKDLVANTIGGQEYLLNMERFLIPELDSQSAYIKKVMENQSFVLYEFTDLPKAQRVPLYLDTDWNTFIRILSSNLELTRYYDLRYPMISDDLVNYDQLTLVTSDLHSSSLDLYVKTNPKQFFGPSSIILPFSPNQISSAYYLSPMFRLFQFFADTKYNRLNMITPGLWGTIHGSFIGLPRATTFRIDVSVPENGEYHLLMRGAVSDVDLEMSSRLFDAPRYITLASEPANLTFYDKRMVFTSARTPMDISNYTPKELGMLIPSDVVVINNKYQYFDLGTVMADKGTYPIYFKKFNDAPMLVEGILAIPEEQYQSLTLPSNVTVLQASQLCCGSVIMQGQQP